MHIHVELWHEIFFFFSWWHGAHSQTQPGVLAVREISRRIVISGTSRIGSSSSWRRAKVGKLPRHRHVLKSSMLRHHLPLEKVHIPLLPGCAAFCLVAVDGGCCSPLKSSVMSRAEPEEEMSLRCPHIKPPDCYYCLFYSNFAPPSPSLSSSSHAEV